MKTLTLRLIVALVIGVTLVSLASSWYEVRTTRAALRAELESKAESLGQGLATEADATLRAGDTARLELMVLRYPLRDHLLGIGIYDRDGAALVSTPGLARLVTGAPRKLMKDALQGNRTESEFTLIGLKHTHLQVTPIRIGGTTKRPVRLSSSTTQAIYRPRSSDSGAHSFFTWSFRCW